MEERHKKQLVEQEDAFKRHAEVLAADGDFGLFSTYYIIDITYPFSFNKKFVPGVLFQYKHPEPDLPLPCAGGQCRRGRSTTCHGVPARQVSRPAAAGGRGKGQAQASGASRSA